MNQYDNSLISLLIGLRILVFLYSFSSTILVFSLAQGPGLFEPIHGSAPDIAGRVGFNTFA